MKARLKINYGDVKTGQIFQIKEMLDRFAALDINGRIADFGYGEIEIISESLSDDFFLGQQLINTFGNTSNLMRQAGINKLCIKISWPIKKTLASRAINTYLWC